MIADYLYTYSVYHQLVIFIENKKPNLSAFGGKAGLSVNLYDPYLPSKVTTGNNVGRSPGLSTSLTSSHGASGVTVTFVRTTS